MTAFIRVLSLVAVLMTSIALSAQHPANSPYRNPPDSLLAPFYHGVASGDPLSDRVMIWTRVTTDSAAVNVQWRVATDTAMTNIVAQGTTTTDGTKDFSVKVDVTGLQPFTFYFYEFTAYGKNSIRGRTRTLPVGVVDNMRFAIASCADYAGGYFNAYKSITDRNDIFAVLHLGDYIYEYGDGQFGTQRTLEPSAEILTLADYRMRHSYFKLDPDLMRVHQQYPFITVWDDHEVANDAWLNGADNHTPGTEGDYTLRKNGAKQAYREWMPMRLPAPAVDSGRIYRNFQIGDLMDLQMLDTRHEHRDEQTAATAIPQDTNRTIMGRPQYNWLLNQMRSSSAKWQILGQQVMMAPLTVFGQAVNADQWDGYPAERARLYTDIGNSPNITNFVVLTGDIHTSWAMDLPLSGYVSSTGANSIGVEFVTTSVTSSNFSLPVPAGIIQTLNPHIKYANLTDHGYTILDVNKTRCQSEWYALTRIDAPDPSVTFRSAWLTLDGSRRLTSSTQITTPNPIFTGVQAPLPPRVTPNVSVATTPGDVIVLSTYPNPFADYIDIQAYTKDRVALTLTLSDIAGNTVMQTVLPASGGTLEHRVYTSSLPQGVYMMSLSANGKVYAKKLVKI